MRKQKLLEEQTTLVEERGTLLAAWDAEDRGPSDEEKAHAGDIKHRLSEIDGELEIVHEHDARLRQAKNFNRDLEPLGNEGVDPPAASAGAPGTAPPIEPPPGFTSFGEFLQATARASTGHQVDPRLLAVVTGMGENVPSDGGFLVEQQRSSMIRDKVFATGEMLRRTDNQPVGAGFNGVKLPAVDESSRADGSRWGGVRAYWVDEGGTFTASKPKIKMLDLRLNKLAALVYITEELLSDAVALESFVTRRVPLELNFKAEDAIVRGSGAGQPMGILNANATVSITKEVGQAATTVVWENIKKMWARMWAGSRANAAWYINQDVEPQLMSMSQVVGTGGVPVYLPANGASGQPYSTLMGRPVIPVEYCATLGTVGDIILADLGQYITIDKGGVQSASSMHVRFINDEMTYRFVFRMDGMPLWTSALTPFKGSNSQSPFITVATRA